MFVRRPAATPLAATILLAACTPDQGTPSSEAWVGEAIQRSAAPILIQPGAQLAVLGVLGNRWAIYQDGSTVYATRLQPGASRVPLSDTGVFGPQVLIAGEIALLWPDQASFTNPQPTRLVIWSPHTGPLLASARTVAPTFTGVPPGIAVSAAGDWVLFIDEVNQAATRGKLILASTDLATRRVVADDVDVDYASGACTPSLGFSGQSGGALPLAAFCAGGEAEARLVSVRHGRTRLHATGLLAPPRVYARDDTITAIRADGIPLRLDRVGHPVPVDSVPASLVFPAHEHGELLAISGPPGAAVLRRVERDGTKQTVTAVGQGRLYSNHAPLGLPYYNDDFLSLDGRLALFPDRQDPDFGLSDVMLVDVEHAGATPVLLSPTQTCGTSFELFTRDSRHALFYCIDFDTGVGSLFTGSLSSPGRQLSAGNTFFQHFGISGSTIIYADNVNFGALITMDLKVADVTDPDHQATVVVAASNNFMVTDDRRTVVYSQDSDPAAAGLYALGVAR